MSLFCRKCLDDVAEVEPTQIDTSSSVEHHTCPACDCVVVKLLFTSQQQQSAAAAEDAPAPTQSQHTV